VGTAWVVCQQATNQLTSTTTAVCLLQKWEKNYPFVLLLQLLYYSTDLNVTCNSSTHFSPFQIPAATLVFRSLMLFHKS